MCVNINVYIYTYTCIARRDKVVVYMGNVYLGKCVCICMHKCIYTCLNVFIHICVDIYSTILHA